MAVANDEAFWASKRAQVALEPGTIQLNTGTCGPVPYPVLQAVQHLRERLARSPSDFVWRQLPARLNYARRCLAHYVGAETKDLLLLSNATIALNLVARSLTLPAGSEILLTDHEYGAMRFLWRDIAGERGWTAREVALPFATENPADLVDAVASAISPQTRVLFFSHVTSPTGLVLPAKELCALAARREIICVIDGAHAVGMVPVDVADIGADFYAANCHKWLLAPLGAGFLHVDPRHRALLRPLVTSWGWDFAPERAEEDSGWGGSFWARNLEFHGTQDRTPQLVLPEVLQFRASLGEEAVWRRMRHLSAYARRRFAEAGFQAVTPADDRLAGSMTSFATPSVDSVRGRDYLWQQFRIEAPFTTAAGRTFLRVSTAWFTLECEIDRLAEVALSLPWSQLA